MSFSPPDDRRVSLDVVGNMAKGFKAKCIVNPLSPQACLDLTSALDFAVTMRLHSAIFCSIASVPFIDITHHSKNKSYLETEGLSYLGIDYYELSVRVLEDKFKEVNNNYKNIKEFLLLRAQNNKTTLYETIQNVYIP